MDTLLLLSPAISSVIISKKELSKTETAVTILAINIFTVFATTRIWEKIPN